MRNQFRTKLDVTENVALAYNYQGTYWTKEKDWQFVSYDFEAEQLEDVQKLEKQSNEIRHFFKEMVPPFLKKSKNVRLDKEGASVFTNFSSEWCPAAITVLAQSGNRTWESSRSKEPWNKHGKH